MKKIYIAKYQGLNLTIKDPVEVQVQFNRAVYETSSEKIQEAIENCALFQNGTISLFQMDKPGVQAERVIQEVKRKAGRPPTVKRGVQISTDQPDKG